MIADIILINLKLAKIWDNQPKIRNNLLLIEVKMYMIQILFFVVILIYDIRILFSINP